MPTRRGFTFGLFWTRSYAQGTLQYHLQQLADEELIDVSDDGQYTRYYPAADFDKTEQTVMNALRREYSRRILAHPLADGPLSTTDLSNRIEKAQSTISWHLSNLTDADLVTRLYQSFGCEIRALYLAAPQPTTQSLPGLV